MGERDDQSGLPDVDTDRPGNARVYDLLLGGKNSFEVDRQFYRQILKIAPETPELAQENRRWLAKVVDLMAREGSVLRTRSPRSSPDSNTWARVWPPSATGGRTAIAAGPPSGASRLLLGGLARKP